MAGYTLEDHSARNAGLLTQSTGRLLWRLRPRDTSRRSVPAKAFLDTFYIGLKGSALEGLGKVCRARRGTSRVRTASPGSYPAPPPRQVFTAPFHTTSSGLIMGTASEGALRRPSPTAPWTLYPAIYCGPRRRGLACGRCFKEAHGEFERECPAMRRAEHVPSRDRCRWYHGKTRPRLLKSR
jgi:hypothetical protein